MSNILKFFLIVLAFASITSAQVSQTLDDPSYGYKLTIPPGFTENKLPLQGANPDIVHMYIRGQLEDRNNATLILITRMHGTLGRETIKAADLPPGSKASTFKTTWKGYQIDAFEVPETVEGMNYLTYNAQIPLSREAIQIGVFGTASRKAELRALMDNLLSNLEGETNWSGSGPLSQSAGKLGQYTPVIILVAVVVVAIIVVQILFKSKRPTKSSRYP